jgi:hypothetical protein
MNVRSIITSRSCRVKKWTGGGFDDDVTFVIAQRAR